MNDEQRERVKYLYDFERAVNVLICNAGEPKIARDFYTHADRKNGPGFHLSEGMWTNAHAYYCSHTPVEEGARRFYEDVLVTYHGSSLEYARKKEQLV